MSQPKGSDATGNTGACAVPIEEQCAATLAHYERLANVAHEWNNQVPQAIRAWYAAKATPSSAATESEAVGIVNPMTGYGSATGANACLPSSIAATDEAWISVYDHFPQGQWAETGFHDISEQVLVCTEGGVGAAAYDRARAVWFSGDLSEGGRKDFPSHVAVAWWRPMPKGLTRAELPYPWMSLEENARRCPTPRSATARVTE